MAPQEQHIKTLLDATGLFGIIAKIEVYKKVILAYDPDLDERLKEVVDIVSGYFRSDLQVVHECDGVLTMIWKTEVPECFLPGETICVPCADGQLDPWLINYSTTSLDIVQLHNQERLKEYGLAVN